MPRSARRPITPLYWLAAGLLVGQLLAPLCPGTAPRVAALAIAALTLAAHRRTVAAWPIALLALSAAVGLWQVGAARDDGEAMRVAGSRAWVRGTIVEPPQRQPHATRMVVALQTARRGAEWQPLPVCVSITLRRVEQPWRRGDALEALLPLRRPRNFGNPDEYDYEAFLARRGIALTAFAADDRGWTRLPAARDAWTWLDDWRAATAAALAAHLDPAAVPIAAALLLGDMAGLDDAVRERFARAGVSHVLSISGLHIGLVAAAAFAALRWLLARSERLLLRGVVPHLATAASLLPVVLYGALAGDNVATRRAEAMGVLVAAALLLERPRDWLAPLAAAAAGIALCTPGAPRDIGFQLSFAAVLGIVLGAPRLIAGFDAWAEAHLLRLRDGRWGWLRWVVVSQAVGACAVLATTPLIAWHFNQMSLIAPLANPLVLPLLGGLTIGAGLLGTLAVAIAPPAVAPLFAVVDLAVRAADRLTAWLAAWPLASVRVVTPSLLELALLYGLLGACLLRDSAWRRRTVLGCALALTVDAGAWALARTAPGALRLTFVSVGQGDCTLVEFPAGHVLVVDGGGLGGHFDVGARVVAPQLWRRKIAHVDWLALTHPDFDHYGGLAFLTETFAPRALWWNGSAGRGPSFASLHRALAAGGVALVEPPAGAAWSIDGVTLRVLHPPAERLPGDNDDSLVLQLRYGGRAVLLPGDLEAAGEAALVQRWGATLASDVVKVPHHGSRTSSSAPWLRAVAPRLAVISAGADNRFGFPHPEVERAYARAGAEIWRTDRDGAVSVTLSADGVIAVAAARRG
ncbi:MAG: DNA internalization-related competence protein ComEC/Rec2 [Deltaproteobacteria bacterium]|nr:DNA internalization-related competence protein ComEC/Rec2 [Deltaproteobacteria bacterium]